MESLPNTDKYGWENADKELIINDKGTKIKLFISGALEVNKFISFLKGVGILIKYTVNNYKNFLVANLFVGVNDLKISYLCTAWGLE